MRPRRSAVVEAGPVPVAVDVAGSLRSQVLRVVEGTLGWQVVDAADSVLPPRCVLVDAPRAAAHAGGGSPVVLVVGADDDPGAAARAARHASEVTEGVPDAATLQHVVARLAEVAPTGRAPWCTVAAAAGGVGATTVATALAGLRAWRHGATLLAASGPCHQESAPTVAASDLASPAAWAAASPAVAVSDLRVVRLRDPAVPVDAGPVPLVVELGVGAATTADVVVVRPDRPGAAATERGTGAVVVVGRGPVAVGALRRAAAGRLVVACPWSARVAAAAAAGRLPADVPGTWLQPLAPVVTALTGRAAAVAS